MTTQTIRSGTSIDVPIPTGQTLKVVAVSGTYTITVIRGTGIGTALATAATGGSYGTYAYDSLVRIVASADSEIDYDVAVSPVVSSDTVPSLAFDSSGNVTGLVGQGGAISVFAFIPPSGDTTGVKDRTAIQTAINNLPSTGGEVRLSAGGFYIGSEITVTKPVKITGAGGGIAGDAGAVVSVAPTTINVTSQTANGFNVSASGCTFRDFALVNTYVGTPTAGAGILSTSNTTTTIDSLTVLGFWNLLDLGGVYYSVTNCRLYDGVNYYVYHHSPGLSYDDHGDFVIANCVLSGWAKSYTATAQLRWESGGGIKIVGNKFNGATQPGNSGAGKALYCIQLLIADGKSTGSLVVTGNSISSAVGTTANMYIGQLGPTKDGTFTSGLITGNEFAVGVLGVVIEGNATYSAALKGFRISENIFSFFSSSAIKVRYARRCHIGQNSHNGITGSSPVIDIPDLTSDCAAMSIDKQHFDELLTSKDIIRDNRSIGNTITALNNGVVYDYTHGLAISAVSTWTQVFKLEITNQIAGKFTFDIDGRSADTGNTGPNRKGVCLRQERAFDVSSAGAVTLSTIGTDFAGGAASAFVAVRYTVTTNWVAVEVQTTDVTNCVLWGLARLRVNGKLQTFHIGT